MGSNLGDMGDPDDMLNVEAHKFVHPRRRMLTHVELERDVSCSKEGSLSWHCKFERYSGYSCFHMVTGVDSSVRLWPRGSPTFEGQSQSDSNVNWLIN